MWKVYLNKTYLGTVTTEKRFELLKESVAAGIIPADYSITDVKFELIS